MEENKDQNKDRNKGKKKVETCVLLVEDSETDAYAVKRILDQHMKPSCRLKHVETMAETEEFLKDNKNKVDVILLDLNLPDTTDREDTYKKIRKAKGNIPVIILTSVQDHDLAVKFVKSGAQDYVRKSSISSDPQTLCYAIDFAISRDHNLQLFEKQKERELKEKDNVIGWVTGKYSVDKK